MASNTNTCKVCNPGVDDIWRRYADIVNQGSCMLQYKWIHEKITNAIFMVGCFPNLTIVVYFESITVYRSTLSCVSEMAYDIHAGSSELLHC